MPRKALERPAPTLQGEAIHGVATESTLADDAYQRIREMIVTGRLGYGAVVSRRQLAIEFGMSTLPVGDALQRLESDGIVESRPRVGTRVKIPSARSVRGHFIVREALEAEAARLFAERASFKDRDELRKLAAEVDQSDAQLYSNHATTDVALEAHKRHMNLHLRIAEGSGYRELRDAVDRIHGLIFYWLYDISAQDRNRPAQQWHEPLVAVITGTDPDAADRAMRNHIRYGMDGVLDMLEPQLKDGQWRLRPKSVNLS